MALLLFFFIGFCRQYTKAFGVNVISKKCLMKALISLTDSVQVNINTMP